MIQILFTPPDGDADWDAWMREGNAATARMFADPSVQPIIDDNLYKRQRDRLLAATSQKCAYCELRLAAGQRKGDVEHYRPKSRVRRMDGKIVQIMRNGVEVNHPGYFWLAYDYRNLLPACIACNRRAGDDASGVNTGKGDIFPTLNDRWAATPEELPTEQPAMLNPYLDDPREHLLFDPDTGLVMGTTERGRVTVNLLGLNRDGLPEARKDACGNVRRAVAISAADAVRGNVSPDDSRMLQSIRDGSAEFAAICRLECIRSSGKILAHLAGVTGEVLPVGTYSKNPGQGPGNPPSGNPPDHRKTPSLLVEPARHRHDTPRASGAPAPSREPI